MKKVSSIITAMVVFAGMSFAQSTATMPQNGKKKPASSSSSSSSSSTGTASNVSSSSGTTGASTKANVGVKKVPPPAKSKSSTSGK